MQAKENKHDGQLENKHLSRSRRRAIDQMAIGLVILLWGSLLTLKQVGIIDKNESTWPFALTAFGILLVVGGVYKLSIANHSSEELIQDSTS
jgi:hypothetical protein